MTDLTLADESVDLVRQWIDPTTTRKQRRDPAAERLAHVLKDPKGLDFTIGFVDRVIRPDDKRVAAHNLRALSRHTPKFLPSHQRILIKLGAFFSVLMPGFVVTMARRTLRKMVSHLILDARPNKLGMAIAKLGSDGDRLNLNLLGEAVLGDREAARRLKGTQELLAREDVDYVSVKVSAVASQLSMWGFDETVARVVEQLTPLYELAAAGSKKFINLDMEEYRDLDLTVDVFTKVLDRFPDLEAGIVLQAYLPDALGAMKRVQTWAAERRINGGSPIKVRVVKGANLAMERVDAIVHGWPQATYLKKQDSDTNYKRVLNYAFTPERMDAVRIGVAGQNLFDIAYAWLLAGRRSVRGAIDFEMLLGMAPAQAAAVRNEVGQLLLYTPVVHPEEFDVAISYLVRRLEENASPANFMSAVFELSSNEAVFEREKHRFIESVKALDEDDEPTPQRIQNRTTEVLHASNDSFRNTPDTDTSLPANRAWGRAALSRSSYTQMGAATVKDGTIPGPASLESLVRSTQRAGIEWGARDSDIRAWLLHQCATALSARRGELISVMAAETGKTIAEADVEVSEAIDFANYYAEAARRLDAVDGATFKPAHLTVVTPPWNFPVAIPAGSVLAALASGSAVIIKPAHQARRCAAVLVEALWEAGIPRNVLGFATIDEGALGKSLVSHPLVDRVILTGAWETAALFRSWRTDLPLLAETSGKNAIVVTPSADFDHAAADIATSAFGHAGQKCSAASLVILVGSVAHSDRFHRQLVDAITSQRVGYPEDPTVFIGPIIEPAQGKLAEALTILGAGEEWLIQPKKLDESGRLWSPGVRTGVVSGSQFHTTEYFGPVLGIMHARNLDEAISFQNATAYGLTAGLHSLDPDEVNKWIDTVEAGNLYVNRGITGAIVQRQPFGGWKRSSVGTTGKAGGPNYLTHLGSWESKPLRPAKREVALSQNVLSLLDSAKSYLTETEVADLKAAAASDQIAWMREFGIDKDVSGLDVERNVFRYLPVPVTVRFGENGSTADLVRVLIAADRVGADVSVSSHRAFPSALAGRITVEDHSSWLASAKRDLPTRVRLVESDAGSLADAVGGNPDVAIYGGPVTQAGRLEALPFLREQAVTITTHRFGNHDAAFDAVLPKLH